MANYPEHEKLKAVAEVSQKIGEFLVDFLGSKGIHLARYDVLSDACRNCKHDDPHKTGRGMFSWFCGVGGCKCDHNYRGNPDELGYIPETVEQLLAEFFGINQARIDAEKDEMLAKIRKANQ